MWESASCVLFKLSTAGAHLFTGSPSWCTDLRSLDHCVCFPNSPGSPALGAEGPRPHVWGRAVTGAWGVGLQARIQGLEVSPCPLTPGEPRQGNPGAPTLAEDWPTAGPPLCLGEGQCGSLACPVLICSPPSWAGSWHPNPNKPLCWEVLGWCPTQVFRPWG